MNKEQYLRYVIIIMISIGVIAFNHQGNKESPEDVQQSEHIQDNKSLNHAKRLK